jgi:peroxiredoxin
MHDPGGRVSDAYGLNFTLPEDLQEVYAGFGLDLPAFNGDGRWQLPMPARYVIDPSGTIRYASVHPDYTTRPEPVETLEALQAMANA